ncbi:MAG: prepilin peptidase [Acetatifactor sp.]|nr:prepilin peptidase [Acetatifactor sp.]
MTPMFYAMFFIFGTVVGSFLNVLIYRIPLKQDFVKMRSHCMNCGYELKPYDLVPVLSYIALGGKCRKCKTRLSVQYPLIELLNGCLWLLTSIVYEGSYKTFIYCMCFSALIALSVIDFRTYEIPIGFSIFIFVFGIISLFFDYNNWADHGIGLVCVSGFLLILYLLSRGRAIGGGDIKLMAACGLLIGWKSIILAFLLGCIIGSVIHLLRMKISNESHVLAMGPYLSAGVIIAALWGDRMINWYINMWSVV